MYILITNVMIYDCLGDYCSFGIIRCSLGNVTMFIVHNGC